MFKSLLKKVFGKAPLEYEQAKKLAMDKDVNVRLKLACREDLAPEILYFLAEDPNPQVRRAIAQNISAPRKADLLLSQDADSDVRSDLASKIEKILPDLSRDEMDAVRLATHKVIEHLAHDQALRVRRILSDTLKDIAHAPADVIKRLANDVELVVCAPVLENSQVLTEEDLINIISSSPVKGALSAISRRTNVSENITDAISDTDDVDAIAEMLGNVSAQIREDTLDQLINRAEDIEIWHSPLAGRPKLSQKAVLKLAEFVAENVFETLKKRPDLDEHTAGAVREEFSRRIEAAERSRTRDEGGSPEKRVKSLHALGRLDDTAIKDAAQSGDVHFVKAALALKAKIRITVVNAIFDLASVKGIISLCWQAKLSVATSVVIQKRIANISARDVQGSLGGDFPYTNEEMTWQLNYFKDSV